MAPRQQHLLAGVALAVALVAAWWRTLHDAAFWDGMFYTQQIHDILVRGLDAGAYRDVPFLRPPLYTVSTALAMRLFGERIAVAHVASWLWALAALPALWRLARRLGAGAGGAWLAVGLFVVAPPFLPQGGQILTDLPVTALITWAWSFALEGSLIGFVAVGCAAVLCKEVGYFVCLPAFAWFAWQRRERGWLRAGLAASPALVPGLVLAGWLVAQHALTGTWLYASSRDAIGPRWLVTALNRTFIDQGRVFLWLVALAGLVRLDPGELRARRIATAAAAASLPLLFPAPLPRYMLPSLPLICALAAVALEAWAPARRRLATAGLVVVSIAFWFGPIRGHAAPDFDSNLVYRRLLDSQHQATVALVAARPRALLAAFPMWLALRQPSVGEVSAPMPADIPPGDATLAWLCGHDALVEGALGAPVKQARDLLQAAGALGPPTRYGSPGLDVTVYPIRCR